MWKPRGLARASNVQAVRVARAAATALARRRVEHLEIEQHVVRLDDERRSSADRTTRVDRVRCPRDASRDPREADRS